MAKRLKILVTNDDGIDSKGIVLLARTLLALGDVYVVAPDREQSAIAHSLTLHRPLRVERIRKNFFAVDGTPADCVHLGVHILLPERPQLIVSGINKGGNLGDDITYSGTVSAAFEGTLLKIPSMAVSLVARSDFKFETAARVALKVAKLIARHGLPQDTLLNVNVPNVAEKEIRTYRITKQGRWVHNGGSVIEKVDPRGRKYYWIGGGQLVFDKRGDTDFEAVSEGSVSITPLHLDLTDYDSLALLKRWKL